jgi:hypothetical protein
MRLDVASLAGPIILFLPASHGPHSIDLSPPGRDRRSRELRLIPAELRWGVDTLIALVV